jgi:hypothetical protein
MAANWAAQETLDLAHVGVIEKAERGFNELGRSEG